MAGQMATAAVAKDSGQDEGVRRQSVETITSGVSAGRVPTAASLSVSGSVSSAAHYSPFPSRQPSFSRHSLYSDHSVSTQTQTQTQTQAVKDENRDLADELDFVNVSRPLSPAADLPSSSTAHALDLVSSVRPRDKASRVLGIRHRQDMEPIPASARTSLASARSAPTAAPASPSFAPTSPLTSLYVVSGLPKSPHTWTLADPDSVLGLSHSDGAVNRWWRADVLGSTVSPGAGGGKRKRRGKEVETLKGAGALSRQEVAKMLSKALKLSFTREVEIIASTLQPASTVHTFSFSLPAAPSTLAPSNSTSFLRASVLSSGSAADRTASGAPNSLFPYGDPYSHARPSSSYLGPPALFSQPSAAARTATTTAAAAAAADAPDQSGATVTYHGVCLTVWSHADAERSAAIRRTLEAGRARKESTQSLVAARLRSAGASDPGLQARNRSTRRARGPWAGAGANTDAETDYDEQTDGAMSESEFETGSVLAHNPGESTLFLPGDTVFWLPYALTLVSRHPIYDLMRDYLTLSWARFSKDVQSHTLQISKILAHPAPRAGDLIKLDASSAASSSASGAAAAAVGADTSLEVIARFPGGLDFGRGLVDINFTMWPLFTALNVDNVLTALEIALAPTGRVLFFSRHPAMLGVAVGTLRYLAELRGWAGVALQAVHARDAKIYTDDPGPWIIGLATEARYAVRPPPDVCVVDLDINYLACAAPPPGAVSTKQTRERFRQRLLAALGPSYHPDHGVPAEFKEAFPAGRFRPVCKIQARRGGASAAVADTIRAPEWWHSTRVIEAFDGVLRDGARRPSFFKRLSSLGSGKASGAQKQLSVAERHVQLSIRRRATAFVDARDELETKIGRLSRRLNFLVAESDLWRDKFVTFEQYAERLSTEANELRQRIGREQRETKRLSGLVNMTAAEKAKLQSQLRETEGQHKEAMRELERMRETMETMELERAEMVAEVEAQIERALASMAADLDAGAGADSDWDSRPGSRASSRSGARSRSRRPATADAGSRLRSFGTESTLAESFADDGAGTTVHGEYYPKRALLEVAEEEDEAQPLTPSRAKRFSAIAAAKGDADGMRAVDEGISARADGIAKTVAQIQQTLESALATERQAHTHTHAHALSRPSTARTSDTSDNDDDDRARAYTRRPQRRARRRSGTASSRGHTSATETATTAPTRGRPKTQPARESAPTPELTLTPPARSLRLRTIVSDASDAVDDARTPTPELTPSTPVPPAGTTDEGSDTDFVSASSSPRTPHAVPMFEDDGEGEGDEVEGAGVARARDYGEAMRMLGAPALKGPGALAGRTRVSSVATVTVDPASPTLSDSTIVRAGRR